MKREKTPIIQDPEATRKLESLKYVFRSPQNALENGDSVTYEWLEDSVIRKKASVKFGRDALGKDTATIRMLNPKTEKEEDVYYATDKVQVARLRGISEGKTLILEIQDKEPTDKVGH